MLVVPTFAAKPDKTGNGNKPEKNNDKGSNTEKKEKEDKIKIEETEDGTLEVIIDEIIDTDGSDTEDTTIEDYESDEASDSSDKISKFLKKWQRRLDTYSDESANEDTDSQDQDDETHIMNTNKGPKAKDQLPHGLTKKDELPSGLDKKEVLPYGLLKRIDPEAIPPGHVQDDITGDDINIKTLLVDSVHLLETAVEGGGMGEYFSGSIEDYERALTAYTDLVNDETSTEEILQVAVESLNDAYNTFIMSRRATQDELDDYNNFLEEVDSLIEDLEVGQEDDEISQENYDALVAYFDTLDPYDEGTLISIEAMLTLFDQATEKFDQYTGYEDIDEPSEDEIDAE